MADVTDADFETAVIERSKTVPVVVDLWAPWCGPCQALGPILEEVIGETKGLVELAKVNVDENPSVHQAFQVQGIPAVYAMIDGQVVDGFVGGQPKDTVVEFVQRLLDMKAGRIPNPADETADETVEDASGAPADDAAPAADAAAGVVGVSEPRLSEPGVDVVPVTPSLSTEESDAVEAKLKDLLVSVKGNDEDREEFLSLLEQLGPDDPRTNTYRRRLATALF